MAAETVRVLEDVVGGPAHLVGWSDGGIIALLVALRRPDLVRKLVVVGANYHFDGVPVEMDRSRRWRRNWAGPTSSDRRTARPIRGVLNKSFRMFRSEPTLTAGRHRSNQPAGVGSGGRRRPVPCPTPCPCTKPCRKVSWRWFPEHPMRFRWSSRMSSTDSSATSWPQPGRPARCCRYGAHGLKTLNSRKARRSHRKPACPTGLKLCQHPGCWKRRAELAYSKDVRRHAADCLTAGSTGDN